MADDPPDVARARLSEELRAAGKAQGAEPQPASDSYIREKLRNAARIINSGDGPIQERLLEAWMRSLHVLKLEDFPEQSDRELFATIRFWVTDRTHIGEDGDVPVAIRAMTDEKADEVASEVLELHRRVRPA